MNTTVGNTPANTTGGNENNNNATTNNTRDKGNNKKKKKNNRGKENGNQTTTPKFEGLLKEKNFKGVFMKCRKPSIQSCILCLVTVALANAKNLLFVADSITFKESVTAKQFVNARENPINYTVKDD